jgi:16S rRNA (adenine1518-N6/adenine1519-N6)-dimethyltransferase
MTSPKRLLYTSKIRPKRKLGQHFLNNPDTADMIVARSNIHMEDVILEIGAGLGALTVPLARAAKRIYAVEIDPSIIPLLKSEIDSHAIDNVTILDSDFLRLDLHTITELNNCKLTIVGNLPYNISSQILIRLIRFRHLLSRCILMFQKELAQRISSNPGSRHYGRISVMLQYCADIRSLAKVNASDFYPRPRVDSEIVEILFKKTIELQANSEAILHSVIKAAFSKRRKTLKNAVAGSNLFGNAERAGRLLEKAGIDPVRRAETLSVGEFVRLSNVVAARREAAGKDENSEIVTYLLRS